MFRRLVCSSLMFLMAVVFCSCSAVDGLLGEFDHQVYVQATLDALYKGMSDEYAQLTNSTAEEVQKLNDVKINAIAEVFIPNLEKAVSISFPRKQKTQIKEIIKNYYKSVSYETQKAEKVDANTYRVGIKVKMVNSMVSFNGNLDNFIADFEKKAENGELEGIKQKNLETMAKKIDALYMQGIVEVLKETVAEPEYGAEETITVDVKLDKEKNMWYITEDEMVKLEEALIVL